MNPDEMDLSAFVASYRADGHGRAAHDPQMMVALLLYAYARGERSSRLMAAARPLQARVSATATVPTPLC